MSADTTIHARAKLGGYRADLSLRVKVLDFIKSSGPGRDRTCDQSVMSRPLYH